MPMEAVEVSELELENAGEGIKNFISIAGFALDGFHVVSLAEKRHSLLTLIAIFVF